MRILILGGDGMLGHQLLKHLGRAHDARCTLRLGADSYHRHGLFNGSNSYFEIDVRDPDAFLPVVADFRPEAVINAVGIIKQRAEARDHIRSLEVNALLPHRLALLSRVAGARFVHFSTDCVFSGRRGGYREEDVPDAEDLYGRTKLLGEVAGAGCITLRTSMIGPELARKNGLLEWFLAQRGGTVKGFTGAIFSGFTTFELARIVEHVLARFPGGSGVYHVAAPAISKYDLLGLVRDHLGLPVTIEPDEALRCDRSLDGSRFSADAGYTSPSWETMIGELARELRNEPA